jgi:hypothetical protein
MTHVFKQRPFFDRVNAPVRNWLSVRTTGYEFANAAGVLAKTDPTSPTLGFLQEDQDISSSKLQARID